MDEPADELLGRAEAAYRQAIADPASAGPVAVALVEEARRAGEAEPLVVGLLAHAWAERALLAGEHAKELLDEAVRVARRAGLDIRRGQLLVVRAAVSQELGRPRSAQRDLELARPLLGGAGLAALEHQTAVLHQNAGRLVDAARIYSRLLSGVDCPPTERAKGLNNLAMIEAEFGRYGAALGHLEQARALGREVGPAYTAYFAEGQATVMAQAGMLPASLDMFEQAERLYELAGLPRAELYAEYAEAMSDLQLLPEAVTAARRALEEFDANRIPLMRAEAELRVARLALLAGEPDVAESAASSAAMSLRRQGRVGWAAWADVVDVEARSQSGTAEAQDLYRVRRAAGTLERLKMTSIAVDAHLTAGRVAVGLGRRPWAVGSFDRAHTLARRSSVLIRLKGHQAAASAAALRGDARGALRECQAGLTDLEQHRGVLASSELRVRASAHGVELGRLGLRCLVDAGSGAEAFRWMERTRAAALVAVQQVALEGFEEELARLRLVQGEMEAAGGGSAAQVARQNELEGHLRRLTWASTGTASSPYRPVPLGEIRGLLGGRLLVEYGVLDGDVYRVVVSQRTVSLTRLAPVSVIDAEVEKLLFLLRLLLRPDPAAAAALCPLAERRIGRLRELLTAGLDLDAGRQVVVVPVGVLQRVPWSVLHDGPVSLSPSAAFWVRACREPAPARDRVLLAAGPGLVAADDEVSRLGGLHDESVVLAPPDSTVARVSDALAQAGTAHFACHGKVRSDNPMFSGLLLSDGLLTVHELELRGIAPYRVVLAACEAAADVCYPGGEMLGFVSALLARGTAGIVASIIAVPDAAASSLMFALHERLRHESMAVALYGARGSLDLADPLQLVNWCGFTAFGAA